MSLFKDIPPDTTTVKTVRAVIDDFGKDLYYGAYDKKGKLVESLMGETPCSALGFTYEGEGYYISCLDRCYDAIKRVEPYKDSIEIKLAVYPYPDFYREGPIAVVTDVRKIKHDSLAGKRVSHSFAYEGRGITKSANTKKVRSGNKVDTVHITAFTNDTNEDQWIFFEPDTLLTDNEMLYERFKSTSMDSDCLRKCLTNKYDWSQLVPDLEWTWVKILRPGETFTTSVRDADRNDYLMRTLRVVSDSDIEKFDKELLPIKDSPSTVVYKSAILEL